jgi:hypothetical protein
VLEVKRKIRYHVPALGLRLAFPRDVACLVDLWILNLFPTLLSLIFWFIVCIVKSMLIRPNIELQ